MQNGDNISETKKKKEMQVSGWYGSRTKETIPGLSWSRWTQISTAFANSVDPDQLASKEANWSGSALYVIMWIFYLQPGSSNLFGWKLEVGVAS